MAVTTTATYTTIRATIRATTNILTATTTISLNSYGMINVGYGCDPERTEEVRLERTKYTLDATNVGHYAPNQLTLTLAVALTLTLTVGGGHPQGRAGEVQV